MITLHAYLENLLVILRGVQPAIPHDVFYQLLVVLCSTTALNQWVKIHNAVE